MKHIFRSLIGKMDTHKLTDEEWDLLYEILAETNASSFWVGIIVTLFSLGLLYGIGRGIESIFHLIGI